MKTIAFFSNKVGSGNTLLAHHVAAMFARLGVRVLAVDLDPQATLSTRFLDEYRLAELWLDTPRRESVLGALELALGSDSRGALQVEEIDDYLGLLVGDPGLARLEFERSAPRLEDAFQQATQVSLGLEQIIDRGAKRHEAQVVVMDLGPNLGLLNRSALALADYLVTPLSADILALEALENLGRALEIWRRQWAECWPGVGGGDGERGSSGGKVRVQPLGYAFLWHAIRFDLPVPASERWMKRIPATYSKSLLGGNDAVTGKVADDPNCLGMLKNHRVLWSVAEEVRKPMFLLKPADGATGGLASATQSAHQEFAAITRAIARRAGIVLPEFSRQGP